MALEENNGNGMIMPVQPMGYGYGGNWGGGFGGFGNGFGFGGDISWILILFLFGMFGGWGGMGGFGGMWGMDGAFPWLLASNANNQNATQDGFNQAATANTLSGIQSAITSGFGDTQLGIAGVNQNICQTGAGITAAINNTAAQAEIAAQSRQSALTQQLYNNEINSLNRSFAEQTANTAAINGVSSQLADCCCENRLASANLQNVIQTENCADRAALSDGIRDVLTATQAQTQAILDKMCQQELDAERRENAELRSRINMLDLAQSQAAQTAALVADNTAQTQYIVNRVAPYPIPAYPVNNPYGCGNGFGYGNGFNNFGGFNPFGNVGFGNGSF